MQCEFPLQCNTVCSFTWYKMPSPQLSFANLLCVPGNLATAVARSGLNGSRSETSGLCEELQVLSLIIGS